MNVLRFIAMALCAMCLGTVALFWIFSQDAWKVWIWERGVVERPPYTFNMVMLGIGDGTVLVGLYRWTERAGGAGWSIPRPTWHRGWVVRLDTQAIGKSSKRVPWYGFAYDPRTGSAANGQWSRTMVYLPLWLFALLFAIHPFVAWVKYARRTERLARNLCANCGYDLRASADRCPECGHAMESKHDHG